MDVEPVITFHGMSVDAALENEVNERITHLERYCDHIVACRVVFEKPHDNHSGDGTYRVRVEATVPPNHDLVVEKQSAGNHNRETLGQTMRDAMKAMEARLKKLRGKQEG